MDGLRKRNLSDSKIIPVVDKEDPEELLKHILSQSENDDAEIYVLEDFHDFIEERNNKILLRQLAERASVSRKHIIIVSSVFNLAY